MVPIFIYGGEGNRTPVQKAYVHKYYMLSLCLKSPPPTSTDKVSLGKALKVLYLPQSKADTSPY